MDTSSIVCRYFVGDVVDLPVHGRCVVLAVESFMDRIRTLHEMDVLDFERECRSFCGDDFRNSWAVLTVRDEENVVHRCISSSVVMRDSRRKGS